jgi:UDP-N-acetylglucosamine transferase subunit ALG13
MLFPNHLLLLNNHLMQLLYQKNWNPVAKVLVEPAKVVAEESEESVSAADLLSFLILTLFIKINLMWV